MRDEWKRTLRTAIQVAIATAPLVPVLVPTLGLSATVGLGASLIAIAAAVTRISTIPEIAELLNKYFKVPMP